MKAPFSWEHYSNKQSENYKYPAKSFLLWNLKNLWLPLYILIYFYVFKNY